MLVTFARCDTLIEIKEPRGKQPRIGALRLTSLAVTGSREDFHPQVDAHAGRTKSTTKRRNQRRLAGDSVN